MYRFAWKGDSGNYKARQEILEQVEMVLWAWRNRFKPIMGRMWDAWQELSLGKLQRQTVVRDNAKTFTTV